MTLISLGAFLAEVTIEIIITLLLTFVTYQAYSNIFCPSVAHDTTNSRPGSPRSKTGSVSSKTPSTRTASGSRSETPETKRKRKKAKAQLKGFFRYTTIVACSCYLISSALITMERTLSFTLYWWEQEELEYTSYIMNTLYYIGRMIVTLIFIGRLYYTFKGSFYQISKCTIRCLICFWLFTCCLALLSSSLYPVALIFTIIFGATFIFFDGILSCFLMYIYIKKLKTLVSKSDDNPNKRLISLMTRYTLLYFVCFVSTAVYFVAAITSSSYGPVFPPGEGNRFLCIFVSMDALCNSLSLWLNLSFANSWYFRLCNCCHKQCKRYFGASSSDEIILKTVQTKDHRSTSVERTVDASSTGGAVESNANSYNEEPIV